MSRKELLPVFEIAEQILQHWHVKYADAGAYEHLPPTHLNVLWSLVEPKLVSCISKRARPEAMKEALLEAASHMDNLVRWKIPKVVEK